MNTMYEAIRDTLKQGVNKRVGKKKRQKNKPWINEKYLNDHEELKTSDAVMAKQ